MNGLSSLSLKLLSLFLALTLWWFVSSPRRERVSERAFAAPISLVGLRRDLVITTPVPDTVSVRLRGRDSDLRALSSQNLEVALDLSWAMPGEASITVRPQAINVPREVEVVSIAPTNLHFRVEQLRQAVVAIRPFPPVGNPPTGYVAGTPTADPDHALISGPASQVRGITEVTTERIIMTGRTETFDKVVGVVSDSSLIRIIDPQTTKVTVPVTAEFGPAAPTSTNGTTEPAKKE
jgi:YbbR domain-containing protein